MAAFSKTGLGNAYGLAQQSATQQRIAYEEMQRQNAMHQQQAYMTGYVTGTGGSFYDYATMNVYGVSTADTLLVKSSDKMAYENPPAPRGVNFRGDNVAWLRDRVESMRATLH